MLLLAVTGLGQGLLAAHRLHKRADVLGRLARLMDYWADRIRATAAPLSDLASEAASVAEFCALPLWHGAPYTRVSLCEAVQTAAILNHEDKRLLVEWLDGWGGGDLDGEVERCRRYAAQFHDRFETAVTEARRRGRSYITLGLCAGGMLALLLGG